MSNTSQYNYDGIDNPYNNNLERSNPLPLSENPITPANSQQVVESTNGGGVSSGGAESAERVNDPNKVGPNVVSGETIDNIWIGTWIKSKNYQPKTLGFLIDGPSGYIECMNLFVSGSATIGGWNVIPGYIYSLVSGTPTAAPNDGIVLASGNAGITIYENTEKRVELGYLSAGVYGLKVYDDDGTTVLFETSDTQKIFSGWTINPTTLANGTNIILDSSNKAISINDSTFGNAGIQLEYNAGTPRAYIGNGTNYFFNFDGTNISWGAVATTLSTAGLLTTISALIGGWNVVNGYIYNLASGTPTSTPSDGIVMASGNEGIIVYENTEKRVELGYLSAGVYGIKGYNADGTTPSFELSDTQQMLAGWNFDETYLYGLASGTPTSSPNDGIVLKSGSTGGLLVYEDTAKRIELGYLSAGVYGLKGYATNGTTVTFELSDTQQKLAGFYFTDTTLATNATTANANVLIDAGNSLFRLGPTSGDYLTMDGANLRIRSSNYVSGAMGAGVTLEPDLLEVGNIACRGIIRTAVFQKDILSVNAGSLLIAPNADVLDQNMDATDAETLTIKGTVTFSVNDILRMKDSADDEYMLVTNIASAPTYTVTRDLASSYAADTNPTWQKGMAITNYGQSGDGGLYLTASDTNNPYMSVYSHAGAPWTTLTTHLRLGNLNGYLGYGVDTFGFGAGSSSGTNANITVETTNGIRLRKGTTDSIVLDTSGNITVGEVGAGLANTYISSGALAIRLNTTNQFSVDTSGNVTVGATATENVYVNSTSVQLRDATTVYTDLTAGVLTLGVATTEHLLVNSTSVQIKDNATVYTDLTAGVLSLGDTSNENVLINTSGVQLRDGATIYGAFAATTTIGLTASEHISISSTAVQIKDGATVYTDLTAGALSLGDTSNEHTLINTSGVALKDGANVYALFAATTTIGLTASEHVSISSTSVQIKDGATVYTDLTGGNLLLGQTGASQSNVYITSGAVYLRNNATNKIVLAADGTAFFAGALTVGDGTTTSGTITLNHYNTGGDTYIAGGTFTAADWSVNQGFIMGIDDSDSDSVKVSIGEATKYLKYDTTNGLRMAGQLEVTTYKTAGEAITDGEAVIIGDASTYETTQLVQDGDFSATDTAWFGQTFTMKGINIVSVTLRLNNTNITWAVTARVSIRATSAGLPTGADLGYKDVVQNKNSASLKTFTFDTPIAVTPNTEYAFIIRKVSANGDLDVWKDSADQYSNGNAVSSADSGSTWASEAPEDFYFRIVETSTVAGSLYLADASSGINSIFTTNFIGFATATVAITETAPVILTGSTSNLTGLSTGSIYYLSNTAGAIATSAGDVSKKIGIALSATELTILNS